MLELIAQLRQLCSDNDAGGTLPVRLVTYILDKAESEFLYEYAARGIAGDAEGEIWHGGHNSMMQYMNAEETVNNHPGQFEMVRRPVVEPQTGEWQSLG